MNMQLDSFRAKFCKVKILLKYTVDSSKSRTCGNSNLYLCLLTATVTESQGKVVWE